MLYGKLVAALVAANLVAIGTVSCSVEKSVKDQKERIAIGEKEKEKK